MAAAFGAFASAPLNKHLLGHSNLHSLFFFISHLTMFRDFVHSISISVHFNFL